MSATKFYIIGHCLIILAMIVGITLCAIHFNNYHLMWWYLLPGLSGGLEVTSSPQSKEKENNK